MKTKRTGLIIMLCFVFLCLNIFSVSVTAADSDKTGSITAELIDKENDLPVVGAELHIYQITDISFSENGTVNSEYTKEFADNGLAISSLGDSYAPIHLMSYAKSQDISYKSAVSDKNGKIVFSFLPCGVYLVVTALVPDGFNIPSPFTVSVPFFDESDNEWTYDISATPKISLDKDESGQKTYISVKKQWMNTASHPESIEVVLLKDGEEEKRVTLNESNNWYFRWDELDKKHSWTVVEENVPKNYTVSYNSSQMTVIILNTYSPDTPEIPDEPTTEPEDELIETGQLNWPVPVFAIAGLLLFSSGWAILNFSKKDEEEA